jgi:hypothetical protein
MPRGSKPGSNNGGGRRPGTPNKATIEKALIAERAVATAQAAGRKLAKDELFDLIPIFKGAAYHFQPTPSELLQQGRPANTRDGMKNGNWDKFEKWIRLLMECATKLAPYESPTFRAVQVSMVADAPREIKTIDNVIDLNDPVVVSRAYQRLVAGTKGR